MKEKIEKLMNAVREGKEICFAYVYPYGSEPAEEYIFEATPENMANFVGAHQYDAEEIVLTDILDRLIMNMRGGFIRQCPNQELCMKIIEHLAPIQMGETEAKDIGAVPRDALDEQYNSEAGMSMMQSEGRVNDGVRLFI